MMHNRTARSNGSRGQSGQGESLSCIEANTAPSCAGTNHCEPLHCRDRCARLNCSPLHLLVLWASAPQSSAPSKAACALSAVAGRSTPATHLCCSPTTLVFPPCCRSRQRHHRAADQQHRVTGRPARQGLPAELLCRAWPASDSLAGAFRTRYLTTELAQHQHVSVCNRLRCPC